MNHVSTGQLARYGSGQTGTAGPQTWWAVEMHLESCPGCRDRLAQVVARHRPETAQLLAQVRETVLAELACRLRRGGRRVRGTTGLLGLGAAALGAGHAWIPMLAWTLLAWVLVGRGWGSPAEHAYQAVLSWMHQPTDAAPATVTAVLLGLTGMLSYAILGPRR